MVINVFLSDGCFAGLSGLRDNAILLHCMKK